MHNRDKRDTGHWVEVIANFASGRLAEVAVHRALINRIIIFLPIVLQVLPYLCLTGIGTEHHERARGTSS